MSKKLELKHLAPYLPYGLKYQFNINRVNDTFPNETREKTLHPESVDFALKYGKPILRPLSDIKHENFTDRTFKMALGIKDLDDIYSAYSEPSMGDFVFAYNELLEHHFDVFGLIDKGLAIDINTLKS